MPRRTELTVYGEAQPAGSKRGFQVGGHVQIVDANPKSKGWKSHVATVAGERMAGEPLYEGPLLLSVTFVRPRPAGHFNSKGELNAQGLRNPYPITRPDATKLLRGVEDALTGVVWRDDSQVVIQVANKVYGEPARVDILVEEIREEDHASRVASAH